MRAIIVLGCKSKRKMRSRIALCLQEIKDNDIIVCTGYGGESEFLAHNINFYKPNNKIIIENKAKNTLENMIYSFEWIEELREYYFNIDVTVISTSTTHYTRAYLLAKLVNKLGRFELNIKKTKKLFISLALVRHICYNIFTNKIALIKLLLRRK